MIKMILHLFGKHDWKIYDIDGPKKIRRCLLCGKIQSTMYDMSYGCTYWTDGEHWNKQEAPK